VSESGEDSFFASGLSMNHYLSSSHTPLSTNYTTTFQFPIEGVRAKGFQVQKHKCSGVEKNVLWKYSKWTKIIIYIRVHPLHIVQWCCITVTTKLTWGGVTEWQNKWRTYISFAPKTWKLQFTVSSECLKEKQCWKASGSTNKTKN